MQLTAADIDASQEEGHPLGGPLSSGNTLLFALRGVLACFGAGPVGLRLDSTGPLTFQSLLLFPDNVLLHSRYRCQLSDTRPCFRFLGVVINTRQSPIWIKRWAVALSAGAPCLGSYEPQKTFGNPAVSKSSGAARDAQPAVTVSWLAGASAWSSPVMAHGRGVSCIIQPRRNARVCRG